MENKKLKNNVIIFIIFLVVIGLICGIVVGISRKNRENWITDYEYLYSKAIQYIEEEQKQNGYDKDEQDYQVFTDYKGFGIEEKENQKYAYMWILKESYYVKNGKLMSSEGSSMAYKFTFENNEVVEYEIPKDGSYYTGSIKDMFPDSIENKVLNYNMDDSKLKAEVEEHYSYLTPTPELDKFSTENDRIIQLREYEAITEYKYKDHLYWVAYNGELNDTTFESENVFVITTIN